MQTPVTCRCQRTTYSLPRTPSAQSELSPIQRELPLLLYPLQPLLHTWAGILSVFYVSEYLIHLHVGSVVLELVARLAQRLNVAVSAFAYPAPRYDMVSGEVLGGMTVATVAHTGLVVAVINGKQSANIRTKHKRHQSNPFMECCEY